MDAESLAGLNAAFEDWRKRKRHVREPVPPDLVARARRAASRHGAMAVSKATKLDRRRLKIDGTGRKASRRAGRRTPAYSRLEIPAAAPKSQPFAELEIPTGLRIRLYKETSETLALLASLCASGGGR